MFVQTSQMLVIPKSPTPTRRRTRANGLPIMVSLSLRNKISPTTVIDRDAVCDSYDKRLTYDNCRRRADSIQVHFRFSFSASRLRFSC